MAEWLTHLTTVLGVSRSSLSGVPFQFYLKILFDFFFSSTAVKQLRTRLTINPQLLCVFLVDNQFGNLYPGI